MTASDRMIAWKDKKKRVKMSKMMKKSVAGAKIQVRVTKGDRLEIKSFKADIVRQKTKIVKSFSEAGAELSPKNQYPFWDEETRWVKHTREWDGRR